MATENDIVLIYIEDSPMFFARVESIWPDVKKDWFNIELLVLQVPLQMAVWTLKDIYINGAEFFMGGKKMRMEVIKAPHDKFTMDQEHNESQSESGSSPFKNKKQSGITDQLDPNMEYQDSQTNPEHKGDKSGHVISLADFQKRKKDNQ